MSIKEEKKWQPLKIVWLIAVAEGTSKPKQTSKSRAKKASKNNSRKVCTNGAEGEDADAVAIAIEEIERLWIPLAF